MLISILLLGLKDFEDKSENTQLKIIRKVIYVTSYIIQSESFPKTLIMRAKRAYDVTTTMTSSKPT